jgi:hypothetical protein
MCSCLVDFVLGVVVKVGAVFDSSSFKEFLKKNQNELLQEIYFDQFVDYDCRNNYREYLCNMMVLNSIIKTWSFCINFLGEKRCFCSR